MVEIYTDGGCEPNPGQGAWGFVVVVDGVNVHEGMGYVEDTTNNRMELSAILEALRYCKDNGLGGVLLYSDSQYSVNSINVWSKAWIKKGILHKKKNSKLIEECLDLQEEVKLNIKWVRGHNGNKWNEYADNLCSKALMNGGVFTAKNLVPRNEVYSVLFEDWSKNNELLADGELELARDFATYLDSRLILM